MAWPFVAVWVEDAQDNTDRNLTVWLKRDRLNPRWLAELSRWTRQNIDLVSSATRNPGTYAVSLYGKDDKGKVLPQGDYFVVESACKHGPYSPVREKVTVAAATFKTAITANNDIEVVNVSFGKA